MFLEDVVGLLGCNWEGAWA